MIGGDAPSTMGSLADPATASPLVAAAGWVENVLIGSIGTGIAVIAVATIGLLMLEGRIPARRGATALLGCFILFGAPNIAAGLMRTIETRDAVPVAPRQPPPAPVAAYTPKVMPQYDPYAGASVPR